MQGNVLGTYTYQAYLPAKERRVEEEEVEVEKD